MKKNKLSQRLNQMARWINQEASIADIGTDHGYLPYSLFEQRKIKNAILCDINPGPLENARNTFQGSNYMEHAEFRLGSGMEPLKKGEVDYVIIAGMGGTLIKEILLKDIEKSKSFKGFFLQPQTEQDVLRLWLLENQFQIINDFYVFEDQKYYEAFYVIPEDQDRNHAGPLLSPIHNFNVFEIVNDLEFGYSIHPESLIVYESYLNYKRRKYEMIKSKIQTDDSPKSIECQIKIQRIEAVINHINNTNNTKI